MPLSSSQEQYLKGLGIGKGAGRGGAISGAGKGAAAGTAIAPGIGTAIGAVVGGIGGLFGGKGRAKKQQAEARAKLEQANAEFGVKEDKRLAKFGAGQSLLGGLSGKGFTNIDPETAAKLGTKRELDPAAIGLYNPSAGAGSEAFSGLIDDAADYALGSEAALGGGAGSNFMSGLGISPGQPISNDLGALQLDDLQNLYKLGGSGTQDFG
jgi:hypothetical protein